MFLNALLLWKLHMLILCLGYANLYTNLFADNFLSEALKSFYVLSLFLPFPSLYIGLGCSFNSSLSKIVLIAMRIRRDVIFRAGGGV